MATKPNHSHNSHLRGHKTELASGYRFNRQTVLLAASLVVVIGFVLILARAAGVFVSAEAESGTRSGPVAAVADGTASGGSAIQFNAPVTPPPPPPPPPPTGVSNCNPALGLVGEQCWFDNTGVLNTTTSNANDRWHGSQIRAGQASAQLQHIGTMGAPQVVSVTQGGTAGNPVIYQNKWITGCLAIKADYVTVRNVYVEWPQNGGSFDSWNCTSQTYLGGGLVSSGDHVGITLEDSEVDGGYSSECSEPPFNYNLCSDHIVDNLPMNIVFERKSRGDFLVQRVNSHGGYASMGYIGGTRTRDSYFHDAGHLHKPCYPGCYGTFDDFHMDVVWAQGQSNWSISHTFGLWVHPGWATGGGSKGCLCDNASSNWVIDNVYLDSGDGYPGGGNDITSDGAHTKVVMQNIYAGGGRITQMSNNFSDYSPGTWTAAFAANGDPIVSHSVCSNLYKGRTTMTKFGC